MIVLDENIVESQRQLLLSWRIRVRQIGHEIGEQGMKDRDQVIPLLQSLRQAVLFARDGGFCDKVLCHRRYSIVVLALSANEAATFVRRFLKHESFNTKAKRVGKICRASAIGIRFWNVGSEDESFTAWEIEQ